MPSYERLPSGDLYLALDREKALEAWRMVKDDEVPDEVMDYMRRKEPSWATYFDLQHLLYWVDALFAEVGGDTVFLASAFGMWVCTYLYLEKGSEKWQKHVPAGFNNSRMLGRHLKEQGSNAGVKVLTKRGNKWRFGMADY